MELDDEMCLCFHVTRRKLENYIQRTKPQRPSQLSECFGAGTGCGWCRPFLHRLWQRAQAASTVAEVTDSQENSRDTFGEAATETAFESLSAEEYAQQRASYRKKKDET